MPLREPVPGVGKANILLVEDNPVYRRLVREILTREGFAVDHFAASCGEAIEAADRFRPDLILIDIGLGDDCTGIEAAEQIRSRTDIPFVFLSGRVDKETVEQAQRVNPYGFVAKPFRPEQLLAAVKTALHRWRFDREIHDNHQWLTTLLASIGDGIINTDSSGIITYINPGGESLLGDDCLGHTIANVLIRAMGNDDGSLGAILEVYRTGRSDPKGRLLSILDPAGRERTVLVAAWANGNGSADSGAVIILRDVTEREFLLREVQGFKLAVDSMQLGVTITDLDRRILYANDAEAQMHGYDREDLVGRSARNLGIKGLSGPNDDQDDEHADEPDRWKRESVNIRSDGTLFPVELSSDIVRNSDGEPVALVTCCQDLTERKRAETEIRKLTQAIEQSPALVLITDVDGTIEYVNPQFCRTTGYSVEEALGQNPRILRTEDAPPERYQDLWKTISSGGQWTGEFLNRKKDGTLYWAFASISGLRDETGVIRHFVGVQLDITQRKELEARLEAQNAELERLNRLKSEMVAITSHDLKSPLHAMVSIATLLKDMGGELDEKTRSDFVDQIIASGKRLSSFISDVLDTETIDAGALKLSLNPSDLGEILQRCVETARMAGREKNLTVELKLEASEPLITADAGRLEQVFNNLLGNAVKFSPTDASIEIVLTTESRHYLVTVSDRGPGIPPEDLEKIFERYYQAAAEGQVAERGFGVGLGLYITLRLVELHGGTVTAENRDGGGCRFAVRLPAHPLAEPKPDDHSDEERKGRP